MISVKRFSKKIKYISKKSFLQKIRQKATNQTLKLNFNFQNTLADQVRRNEKQNILGEGGENWEFTKNLLTNLVS